MDLIYNALMASVKTSAERTGTPSKSGEGDPFQKLMDQKQNAKDPAAAQQETAESTENAVQQPQETETAVTQEDLKELEKRMSLAAMAAMLQNPIVDDTAQEMPQMPADSSVEGLAPVVCPDNQEGPQQGVTLMQADAETVQNPEELGALAPQLAEEQETKTDEVLVTAEEAPEAPAVELKAKTVETGTPQNETDSETPEEAPAETTVFGEVEAAPVKVGEAPKAEKPEMPVEEQIAPKLTEALQKGETRVEVTLTPENLGKVTVEMTWKEDGGLVVQLHAENHRTQGLLEKSVSGLEALLSRENQQEVRVEVPRQQESQQQNFYDGRQGHDGQRQQERRQGRQANSGEDFLQQLSLGLIPGEED